jgi:hypothetical protein
MGVALLLRAQAREGCEAVRVGEKWSVMACEIFHIKVKRMLRREGVKISHENGGPYLG